jgi:hypothetical protein
MSDHASHAMFFAPDVIYGLAETVGVQVAAANAPILAEFARLNPGAEPPPARAWHDSVIFESDVFPETLACMCDVSGETTNRLEEFPETPATFGPIALFPERVRDACHELADAHARGGALPEAATAALIDVVAVARLFAFTRANAVFDDGESDFMPVNDPVEETIVADARATLAWVARESPGELAAAARSAHVARLFNTPEGAVSEFVGAEDEGWHDDSDGSE